MNPRPFGCEPNALPLSYIPITGYITTFAEFYQGKIEVKCGLEIGTRPSPADLSVTLANKLDFCLFECLDSPAAMDFFEFLEWVKLFNIPKGFAHTDIFELSKRGHFFPQNFSWK